MRKLAAVFGALGLMMPCLYAQGLNPPGGQAKDDWEEINFEFNSSVLTDGYPSLLRLAELLSQHRDYKVRIVGHADSVGSVAYNNRLSLARANTVRDFLIKYGANADQITTAGEGKSSPEAPGNTREARFINRRVVLTVTNAQGQIIKEGSINDVLQAIQNLQARQEQCCNQILQRLDRLDDVLAALKNLQGENDKLRMQLDALTAEHKALQAQIAGLPRPLTAQETTNIARTEATTAATNALEEVQRRNRKFSLLGLNIGPSWGPNRFANGDFTASARGQFFSPFGGDGARAVQAQGEYMYYPGRQEGQFDIGLVNRWSHLQAGAFASFKGLAIKEYQNAGFLGQAAFLLDYVFKSGRIGVFGTEAFKPDAVLSSTNLGPNSYLQTYAHVVNQYGMNALFGVWGNAYIEADGSYVRMRHADDMPGANLKIVQPINDRVAVTAEFGLNETFVGSSNKGRAVFGFQFGNYIRPKDYGTTTGPVPMDVPRIRYQFLTRRVGNSPPVADAGPNQTGVAAGTITLNGSGSYDPDGDPLTYRWQQVSGPPVAIQNANSAVASFTAEAGQTYSFRLTVKDSGGLQATATTTVSTVAAPAVRIVSFVASPANIQAGQSATLSWIIAGATSATISPGIGTVSVPEGSVQVAPAQTTTYTLTATGANGSVNATAVVTVGPVGPPQIVRFDASPMTIQAGQHATLSWATNGATSVSISGIGNVAVNGNVDVSPLATTTYTLTASGPNGQSVTAPVTVTVTGSATPQILSFTASPPAISAGQSSQLCWTVNNASSIAISPGVGSNLPASNCASVSPTTTTTYTLTASNAAGQVQVTVTVTVTSGQVQILSFTASATSVPAGTPVTLSWTTANANTVVLIGGPISTTVAPNGQLTITPTAAAVYTLTAYGAGGQTVSASVQVVVR